MSKFFINRPVTALGGGWKFDNITRTGRMGDSAVPVQHVAWIHPQPCNIDRLATVHHMRVSVRHRDAPGDELETGALDSGQGDAAEAVLGDDHAFD